ncbi:MAG: flavodoxin family protein [Candidatus Natronoplasma sp.]
MTRMLICYYSKSGTTEKMAEKILEGVDDSEVDIDVEMRKVGDINVETLTDFDGLIIGSPTYYGLPSGEIKKFIDESITHHGKLDGMVGGAFSSSANPAGGNETTVMALLEALLVHGMIVKGMPQDDHYGPVVIGDPDEREIKQCRYYGEWMAEFTDKIARLE